MEPWALDAEQVALVVAASGCTRHPFRDRAIVALCIDAGLRRHEVLAMQMADFDFTLCTVSVGTGAARRVIRLGHTSVLTLRDLGADRPRRSQLLVFERDAPVTARVVHEQLRRAGELAGLGEWVTCRHTRRTYLQAVARAYPLPIVMRLMGHAGDARHRPASAQQALEAQFEDPWVSPLDALVSEARETVALAA